MDLAYVKGFIGDDKSFLFLIFEDQMELYENTYIV